MQVVSTVKGKTVQTVRLKLQFQFKLYVNEPTVMLLFMPLSGSEIKYFLRHTPTLYV